MTPDLQPAHDALRAAMAAWDRLRLEVARLFPDLPAYEQDRLAGVALARALKMPEVEA